MTRRRITRQPDDERPRGARAAPAVDLGVSSDPLVAYVDELAQALLSRNAAKIRLMLRDSRAFALPKEVREEAIAFKRLRSGSLRTPIHVLRFAYTLSQLAADVPPDADPHQIDLFRPAGDVRRKVADPDKPA